MNFTHRKNSKSRFKRKVKDSIDSIKLNAKQGAIKCFAKTFDWNNIILYTCAEDIRSQFKNLNPGNSRYDITIWHNLGEYGCDHYFNIVINGLIQRDVLRIVCDWS